MVTVSTIRRRARLLFLRWIILIRSHPNRASIAGAVLIFFGVVASCWRLLYTNIPKWSERFGNSVLLLSQNHPHLSRILHVILNALPDPVPLFLGLAGLVYLMPNLAKRIEDSKPLRVVIATFCILFSILAIAVNAINREAQDHKGDEQNTRLATVETTNDRILKAVLNPSPDLSETERRRQIEDVLRNKYILTHSDVSPEVLAGTAWPPVEWMNQELANQHLSWRFSEGNPRRPVVIQQSHPELAKLQFSLWKEGQTDSEFPLETEVIQQQDDGTVSVDYYFKNVSGTATDTIDIWIHLCDKCSFAKEPEGFEKPAGIDERSRHRSLGSLNPGVAFQRSTVVFKLEPAILSQQGISRVGLSFSYSCKNCGELEQTKDFILRVIPLTRKIPLHAPIKQWFP
jgi:hypothetical protein